MIKYANKETSAGLNIEEMGNLNIKLDNSKILLKLIKLFLLVLWKNCLTDRKLDELKTPYEFSNFD